MPRGRPRKFDREQALQIALQLFWTHGYEGTSVALLADRMGIKIPSLYAAFGNKEALFMEAVRYYGQHNGGFYHQDMKLPTSRQVAQYILDHEIKLVTMPDAPDGCLMVQGALVTSPESDQIRQMMATLRRTAEGWMADRFQQAKDEGDLPENADPKALACYIMTVNSGLAVQAKSGATRDELIQVVKIAMANWPTPN